ncbi:hypothetical protein LTR70_000113 [Exophiala xenobiotica]|uniref:Metallo-beta-lactamase domain-containing protein n=1 Tax=Lithohypha guttulata TaxID=1690604 RepID=A0ABR0KP45_9EURO|nr:hypothetical protein LTR24_000238 [Lithohypha guttulata]KAK5330791.1 hypothetical protein LTR70_000113 [Exophiala xenobiotica]
MSQPIHTGTNQLGTLKTSDDLLICRACGTQYDTTDSKALTSCRICDDPRQYVPPSGQYFTTLSQLSSDSAGYHLTFNPDERDPSIIGIRIEPPGVGIGQRALLIQTPQGNILWDLVSYVDEDAVKKINDLGGLSAIVISHPHFYTSWKDWSATFNVPVYLAGLDKEWLNRDVEGANVKFLSGRHTTIIPGVTAIICGGHFPGSMALHTAKGTTKVPGLFHADTIYTVPNALTPDIATTKHGKGHNSYTFMWSIPNMIPLSPDQILGIWKALKGFEIEATYGFTTVRYAGKEGEASIPERILESAKVCVRRMSGEKSEHEIFGETV